MKPPKISILLPVYNTGKYLLDCLSSIQFQTFSDFECICINDGSTDNSLAILEQVGASDSRFRIISQENSGQAASLNRGISLAKGEFLIFVDSDDLLLENSLRILHEAALAYDADLIYGDFEEIEDNYLLNSYSAGISNESILPSVISFSPLEDWLDGRIKVNPETWGKLIRVNLIADFVFPLDQYLHVDTLFNPFLLSGSNKTIRIESVIYKYRLRMGSMIRSNRDIEALDEISKNFLKLLDFAKLNRLTNIQISALVNRCGLNYFLTLSEKNICNSYLSRRQRVVFNQNASEFWRKLEIAGIADRLKTSLTRRILIFLCFNLRVPVVFYFLIKFFKKNEFLRIQEQVRRQSVSTILNT